MSEFSLSAHQRAALREMGIDVWAMRSAEAAAMPESPAVPESSAQPVPLAAGVEQPAAETAGAEALLALNKQILTCTACELHQTRTQAVCGVGSMAADILLVGEAPGADEDQQGEPFVGRAGQLLNEMLRAVGREREQVFIANILKCRPPQNRDPRPAEVASCFGYLQAQIELIKPRLILVVGRIAAQNLLGVDTPIGKLRGRVHSYGDESIPVVVTYHPAYLLRSPVQKRKSWEDLLLAMDVLAGNH